jgi:hypothetical protein
MDFAFDRSHVLLIAETSLEGRSGFCLMLDELPDEVTGLPQGFIAYMAVEPDARRHGVATRAARRPLRMRRARARPAALGADGNRRQRAGARILRAGRLRHRTAPVVQAALGSPVYSPPAARHARHHPAGVAALWFASRIPRTLTVFVIAAFIAFGVAPDLCGSSSGACRAAGRSR